MKQSSLFVLFLVILIAFSSESSKETSPTKNDEKVTNDIDDDSSKIDEDDGGLGTGPLTVLRPSKNPQTCKSDIECKAYYNCVDFHCHHKNIFPLMGSEISGSIILCVLIGLANAGGLGGGPILLPILIGLFHYSQKKSTKIIYVMLFGGSLANYLSVMRKRNSKTGGPLVNYDLILLTLPLLIPGAVLGVLFNKFFPELWLTIYLVYILYDSFKKTYKQALVLYKYESERKGEKGQELLGVQEDAFKSELEERIQKAPQSIKALLEEEKRLFPDKKFFFMGVLLLFLVTITLVKGNDKAHSIIGVPYCGGIYWIINIALIVIFYWMFTMISDYIVRKDELLKNLRPQYIPFTEEKAKKVGRAAFKAGFLGALLGIGGGIVLNPIWLVMGFTPEEVTSTAVLSIFFLSMTSVLMVLLAGALTSQEFIFFFLISFLGSYMISEALRAVVRKFERPSIMLFVLISVLGLALITLPLFALFNTTEGFFHFSSLC